MNFLSKLFLPITAPIRFIQHNFKTVLFLTILFYIAQSTNPKDMQQPNLEVIELNGPIMIVDEILEKIEKAKNDPKIKGVLLKVNSPGGAVAPSVELAYAIKQLNEVKPVVAYASGIMASGSYYASIWSSHIVANPGSMIGSIGVIMQSFDASKLLDTIGVKTQTVKMGEYKEAGTPTRRWTKQEREELEKITKGTYDLFVKDVANGRGLDIKDQKQFANAHIFTASQAKQVGLVDYVDTIGFAKLLLQKITKVEKPVWAKPNKMDKLMAKMLNSTISNITTNLNGLMAY